MNIAERYLSAYLVGCLSGDFGQNPKYVNEVISSTTVRTDNKALRMVVDLVSGMPVETLASKGFQKFIAETLTAFLETENAIEELKEEMKSLESLTLPKHKYIGYVYDMKNGYAFNIYDTAKGMKRMAFIEAVGDLEWLEGWRKVESRLNEQFKGIEFHRTEMTLEPRLQ